MIYLFLTDGFEEIEAIATVDILRRAGLDVRTVSLTNSLTVTAAHGVSVVADMMFADMPTLAARSVRHSEPERSEGVDDLFIIPGGTVAYAEHKGLLELVKKHHAAGGRLAAICAAPAVLGMAGVLHGRRATCYPGYEGYLEGAEFCAGKAVVVDDSAPQLPEGGDGGDGVVGGTIITGRGPGLSLNFALAIVEHLASPAKRAEVAAALLIS